MNDAPQHKQRGISCSYTIIFSSFAVTSRKTKTKVVVTSFRTIIYLDGKEGSTQFLGCSYDLIPIHAYKNKHVVFFVY